MAFTVTLGSLYISINPAAQLDEVIAHPNSTAAVYEIFMENISSDGLMQTIFDAFPAVAVRDVHNQTKVPWPTRYGTTDEPYGSPGNVQTGERPVELVDFGSTVRRWSDAIHAAANSRLSFLRHYADLAQGIAAGIKAALEGHIRTGRVTVPGALSGPGSGTIGVPVQNMRGEVFLSRRGPGGSVYVSAQSTSGFTLVNELIQPIEVSWLVVG